MNKKDILQIIQSTELTDQQKAGEIESKIVQDAQATRKADRIASAPTSVSEGILILTKSRPSYGFKSVDAKIINSKLVVLDGTDKCTSTVSLGHVVKRRAEDELKSYQHTLADGPSSPATYPKGWLLDLLLEVLQ